jgi:hypothetical protein
MKERITWEQYQRLPPASQEKLLQWAKRRQVSVQLSIDQLLDILWQHNEQQRLPRITRPQVFWDGKWFAQVQGDEDFSKSGLVLCDVLWEVYVALAVAKQQLVGEEEGAATVLPLPLTTAEPQLVDEGMVDMAASSS